MKIVLILLLSFFSLGATNTTYDVMNMNWVDKGSVNFSGQKLSGTAAANTTTNLDLTLTDDMLVTGAHLKAIGACEDDEVKVQIVMGSTVVNTFIDWFVLAGLDKDLTYPAKIPAGLKIRIAYKNTCPDTSVKVLVNFNLHKILL